MIAITDCLNTLVHSNFDVTRTFSYATKVSIAETISILYYFKHNSVMYMFHKSDIDFNSCKNLFNSFIYHLVSSTSGDESLTILKTYFAAFMGASQHVTNIFTLENNDIDWLKVLGLK